MHRSARPLREDLDDLEDKSWKRKSYALAQHNALPIPMPHPVYPPPIACPPPAVVIRPSRLRSRPPGAGYRHPASYHPAISQNYYQRPPPPNRLPTLSETNPGTPNQPLPLRKAPPPPFREDPHTETYPLEYGGVPSSQPELSTFRAPPPARPVIQPASQQRHDMHALPSRPPDIDSSARSSNIPVPVARSSHIPTPSFRPSNIPQPQSRIEAVTTPPSRPSMIPERDAPIYDTVQPTFSTFAPPLPPSPPVDSILPPPPTNTLLLPQHILQSSPSSPLKRKISPSLPSPTYLFPQHKLHTSPSPPPPVRKMPPSTPVKPPTLPEPTLPPPPPPITTLPPPQQTQSSHSTPPPVQKTPPAVPIKPPSLPEPMRTPPPPPHTTPLPPQPTLHFPTSSPPVVHKTPPTLPIKPPSTSPQIQPKEPRTDKPLPSPPSPAQKLPHNKKVPVPPRPKEAPPGIPASPAKMPEVTPETQDRKKLLPGAESDTTPPKAPEMHPQCLHKPVIPSKPASHILQADDDGLASTPASSASEPGEEQDTSRIPAVSPDESLGEDSKKLQPVGSTSNLNYSPVKPKPISMQPDSLPEDSRPTRQVSRVPESPKTESSSTTSPTELNSPHEDSSSAPQVSKVSDQHETESSESISNTSSTEDSSSAPQVSKVPETLTAESSPMTSPLSDKTNPQSVTRAPQHLPLTPSSQSRSSSVASIGCLRTPPSIRAAPSWQPIFLPAPLTRRSTSASNSESSLSPRSSNATPRPIIPPDECQNILPTPPSSPSQTRVDNVTPASSISSLPHGHGQSLAGEEEDMQHQPAPAEDGPDTPRSSPPDMTLHNAEKADMPVVNNVSQMEGIAATPSKPVPATEAYQTYKTRFWILTVFSFICFLQTIVWGTFGPIAESAQAAFPSWDDSTIAAFPNWGPIIVVVFIIPMVWLSQRLGLQIAMIVCELFLTLGTMIRCFTSNEAVFTVMCHVSSVLFAFAACFTLSLPAMVAATWFPPSERITATAVGTLMCQLGAAAMYLGALVVRYPSSKVVSSEEREAIRGDIMVLMYIHFGAALLLLLAVAIYFPAKPPTPPSASSEEERIDYFKAFRVIFKKLQMAMVLMVFAFSFGVPVVWIAVLNLSLKDIGINQDKAMGVAVTAVVCSSVTAFIAARITDKVYGHLKVTVITLLAISSVFFLWFLLLTTKVIYPTLGQVYVAVAGGLGFEYATVPLLVELAVEIGFPIPESVTGATLTFVFNIVSLVFLGLFQIPNEGHLWVSCVLLACVSLSIIPLIFVKETHKRSDTDRKFM
ncbi:mucin-2-like isoform X2 [Portunus trituberculatus]|uniref:mucin-2-like isoform X2 n=1 Tax=Portunus trituberculatus TaxID=210409 RepID=UPI001E1CEDA6|nr:mucin-2-like isoform X2 [Portunus trituberculatus]